MILPEAEVNGALKVSRKIRAAVTELSSLKRPVSVSIRLTAPGNPEMEAQLTIRQADQALYESKRMGKNRISVFENARVLDEKEFPVSE